MASQAEIDTAAAKARQGGGQADKDTAAAKAKQNNNNQAAKDTAKAKSRQNGGDGGTSADFSAREAAAGLNLAGNDTTSGRGELGPTFSQREAAAGLNLGGNSTTSGRDSFYSYGATSRSSEGQTDYGVYDIDPPVSFPDPTREKITKSPPYAFEVVKDGDGGVEVLNGGVQGYMTDFTQLGGKPEEIWMEVTFENGVITEVELDTSAGTTTKDSDWKLIASITWEGDVPTIIQGIRGTLGIISCGIQHEWRTLY